MGPANGAVTLLRARLAETVALCHADPRRDALPSVRLASFRSLPRLVASQTELAASMRAWNGGARLLEGRDASRAKLTAAVAANPAVIHLAAHFVQNSDSNAAIVLSLSPSGQDILAPAEIGAWRVAARVVTLSGCRSSSGQVRPGSVLATHGDVPDDSSPIFAAFYRHLGRGQPAAEALRAAQMEMASAHDWRADPRYWAACFVMGKE